MRAISPLISLLWSSFVLSGCGEDPGRVALEKLQCGACHVIPGVSGASGKVGPPLDTYARRSYIAGKFPRDEALLARWVADAPAMSPGTAMPKVEMTASEARDIAGYLYRLR
jgi:cytochrome c